MDKKSLSITAERNYWLDNVKFILIFFVVLGHFLWDFLDHYYVEYLYYFIFLFHIPLFIFLSGFFSKSVVTKDKNKAVNYLLLYAIMQVIMWLIKDVDPTIAKPYYGCWYLEGLVIYNLLLPVIHKFKALPIFIISIIISLLVGIDTNINEVASLSRVFVFLPFFIAGYFTNEKTLLSLKTKRNMIISLFVFIGITVIIPKFMGDPFNVPLDFLWGCYPYKWLDISGGLLVDMGYRFGWYIVVFLFAGSILLLIPNKKLPLITDKGKRTLQVYCLHLIAIQLFKKTAMYAAIDTDFEVALFLMSSVILTLILSIKLFSYPFNYIMNAKFQFLMRDSCKK